MKIGRITMVDVERKLTKEERKNYKKDNPGYRLCFRLRFPNFPEYLQMVALIMAMLSLIVRIVS